MITESLACGPGPIRGGGRQEIRLETPMTWTTITIEIKAAEQAEDQSWIIQGKDSRDIRSEGDSPSKAAFQFAERFHHGEPFIALSMESTVIGWYEGRALA